MSVGFHHSAMFTKGSLVLWSLWPYMDSVNVLNSIRNTVTAKNSIKTL